MPQLILETSANVLEKSNYQHFFKECHLILEKMLPTDIQSCKSRLYVSDVYFIGEGHVNNAFVHMTLRALPGRSADTLQKTGESLMMLMKTFFSQSLEQLNLQITLEIAELSKYFKMTS